MRLAGKPLTQTSLADEFKSAADSFGIDAPTMSARVSADKDATLTPFLPQVTASMQCARYTGDTAVR